MKIYPVNSFFIPKAQNNTPKNNKPNYQSINELPYGYNDHLIMFGARVDKGLERFYDANQDRMPVTVKNYIENLDDKSTITPLQAQRNAFAELKTAQTIEEIKEAFPEEKLFSELKNPTDTQATRGILNSIRDNAELLEIMGQGVLKDKENFTVYIVKKIFLENKTLDEINQDLEIDLDEDLKTDFKLKNPDSPYLYTSTLSALGIKAPQFEYRQSLRYTKDGYSDMMGDKIRAFWDSLPDNERTARAKKSVKQFENWWASIPWNKKLDIIAEQQTELDLLKEFKKTKRPQRKNTPKVEPGTEVRERKHTPVGSSKLSQDELFIKWASNNLKIYEANLSEADKDTIHVKRMYRLVTRWKNMSPEEKSDYISKMKSGAEPLRYTMIDAWNHSSDITRALSSHLKENQVYKPADLLYSSQEFSEFQSRVMTEFWELHPDYSDMLGRNIKDSQEKIQASISNGTFEALKKQIMRDKNQRIKALNQIKQVPEPQVIPPNETPFYFQKFKEAYSRTLGAQLKNLPKDYINDYFKTIEDGFSQEQIEAWTKNLNGEHLSDEEYENLLTISQTEPSDGAKINRAIEATLANILYECTKNPKVYKLSHSDLKVALTQIDRGEPVIKLESHKLNEYFEAPVVKRKIDKDKIANLYRQYVKPLSDNELDEIVNHYFNIKEEDFEPLKKYLNTYGSSIRIIFSDKSAFPKEIKTAMYEKFKMNQPSHIFDNCKCLYDLRNNPFEYEDDIKRIKYMLGKRFDFVPSSYMDKYLDIFAAMIRRNSGNSDIMDQLKPVYTKRTSELERAKISVLPKNLFNAENCLNTLAMEQALADALYEATGNIDVYNLQFEELCDNMEIFRLVKRFPSQTRHFRTINGLEIDLTATKRPSINNLKSAYTEYHNDIVDWVNTEVKNGNTTVEDLMYILNPDEDMPLKDEAVINRIKLYALNLK